MTLVLLAGLALLVAACLVAARAIFATAGKRRDALLRVRSYAVDEQSRRTSLRAPLRGALVLPLAAAWERFSPHTDPDRVRQRLASAGLAKRVSYESFVAARLAIAVMLAILGAAIGGLGGSGIVLALIFGSAGIYLPGFFLSRRAAARAQEISSELPHAIDQLAISMEAGLSFDAGLGHLLEELEGPLADELQQMLNEIRIGESRRRAVKRISERVASPEVMALVDAIVQGEELGISLVAILRAQARDIRKRHQAAAEERAMKAPVKMLFPMVIFILPVMFVVILAPPIIGVKGLF